MTTCRFDGNTFVHFDFFWNWKSWRWWPSSDTADIHCQPILAYCRFRWSGNRSQLAPDLNNLQVKSINPKIWPSEASCVRGQRPEMTQSSNDISADDLVRDLSCSGFLSCYVQKCSSEWCTDALVEENALLLWISKEICQSKCWIMLVSLPLQPLLSLQFLVPPCQVYYSTALLPQLAWLPLTHSCWSGSCPIDCPQTLPKPSMTYTRELVNP